jgi:hypothetical protein
VSSSTTCSTASSSTVSSDKGDGYEASVDAPCDGGHAETLAGV